MNISKKTIRKYKKTIRKYWKKYWEIILTIIFALLLYQFVLKQFLQ